MAEARDGLTGTDACDAVAAATGAPAGAACGEVEKEPPPPPSALLEPPLSPGSGATTLLGEVAQAQREFDALRAAIDAQLAAWTRIEEGIAAFRVVCPVASAKAHLSPAQAGKGTGATIRVEVLAEKVRAESARLLQAAGG